MMMARAMKPATVVNKQMKTAEPQGGPLCNFLFFFLLVSLSVFLLECLDVFCRCRTCPDLNETGGIRGGCEFDGIPAVWSSEYSIPGGTGTRDREAGGTVPSVYVHTLLS